ncbi:MAG: flagellar basal body rod protein FlgC [Deltaproteobacteria bacterium]|nr:flagellar basal body rod protein FlgC [Deltaproteobacteria bacterium]
MFNSIYNIAAEALSANRLRINVISSNIANAQTTRTAEGGPYKRREVVMVATDKKREDFASALDEATLKGVKVAGVVADETEPRKVYDPSHPDADPTTGMVAMPNINAVTEMTNMVSASTAYKAAAEIVSVTKEMANALRILAQRF